MPLGVTLFCREKRFVGVRTGWDNRDTRLKHCQNPALPSPGAGQTTASRKASGKKNSAFKIVQ